MDNQGTGSVYSLLCTQQGVNGSDEAVISIYRQGELKGSFVDNGNGELEFSSEDGSVKGIIQINGWAGMEPMWQAACAETENAPTVCMPELRQAAVW